MQDGGKQTCNPRPLSDKVKTLASGIGSIKGQPAGKMSADRKDDGRRRRLNTVLFILGLVLVFNAAYLAAYSTPDLFYVLNDLLHPLIGVVVAVLFAIYLRRHRGFLSSLSGRISALLFAAAAGFGVYLFIVGMTQRHNLALYFHVGCSIGGLFFLLVRLRSWLRDHKAPSFAPRIWQIAGAACVGALVFYGGATVYQHYFPSQQYIIRNPLIAPTSMYKEGGGDKSLIWPSSAQSANGGTVPREFFLNARSCEPCHKDIYRQWYDSMHHYSSFNDQWYRKAIEYMQDTVGIKSSMWCAGCHDQAVAFTDMMQKYPIREIEHTPEALAGLSCVSCHSIERVTSTMGNGSYIFKYPPLDRYASSRNPVIRDIAYFSILLDPKPHRAAFFRPFLHNNKQNARFCSVCHKVHLDVPVNHYRWIRGFDDYDHWQASGVSGHSARSFYYPPKPLTCVECHMPLVKSNDYGNIDGYVNSHRFVAANTAVPTSYGHMKQVNDVEDFLKADKVTVDIFGITQEPKGSREEMAPVQLLGGGGQTSTMFAVGEESARGLESSEVTVGRPAKLMAPLNRGVAYLRRGETARVDVVVRTRGVGHFFPGGTVDAQMVWVELKAVDNNGHIIFWSGEVADNGKGPVDPGAQVFRSYSLDAGGHWINKRNSWSDHADVYVHLIPPGAAATVHFRIKVPKDCGNKITFTAKLNYRKFNWWITQWAFSGKRDPFQKNRLTNTQEDNTKWIFDGNPVKERVAAKYKKIPNVPIVVMSEDKVTIPVLPASNQPFQQNIKVLPQDVYRWNDYGIGLLLQGDLKGAERAFKMAVKANPRYANGWVNIARALVQEGNVNQAIPYLKTALGIDPPLASAHYYLGLVYETNGKYPQAYKQFAAAAATHPVDRVVSNAMGRILFLEKKYKAAVKQFKHTLSIDPENLAANYNLMLCYRGLQDYAMSNLEEKLYLRFKALEISRAITGPFKRKHPNANNLANPIHEEVSINDEQPEGLKFYWNYGQRWGWLPGKLGKMQNTALAHYKVDGSYDYLADLRRARRDMRVEHKMMAELGIKPVASHQIPGRFKSESQLPQPTVAELEFKPQADHKIVMQPGLISPQTAHIVSPQQVQKQQVRQKLRAAKNVPQPHAAHKLVAEDRSFQ